MNPNTPGVPFAADSVTSRAAAASAAPNADTTRERMFRHLLAAYEQTPRNAAPCGLTCDELERLLGIRPNVASARIWELRKAGRVIDSGSYRLTRRNRLATVWRVRLSGENPDAMPSRKWSREELAGRLRAALRSLDAIAKAQNSAEIALGSWGVRELQAARMVVADTIAALA